MANVDFYFIFNSYMEMILGKAGRTHWASGKMIMFHQCKTCNLLKKASERTTSFFSEVT